MVLEGYGVEKYYESLKESLAYICRVNKYRATEPNERDVAVVPHTDSSFMTILDQNEVNGLEVKSKDGSWVPVDFPPSSFALVAGDGLLVGCIFQVFINLMNAFMIDLFSHFRRIRILNLFT